LFKEILHYITLDQRSRSRLLNCLQLLKATGEFNHQFFQKIHTYIIRKGVSQAIKALIKSGEGFQFCDNDQKLFWDNLYQVAVEHKMVDLQSRIKAITW
jgi:hypothetical protein